MTNCERIAQDISRKCGQLQAKDYLRPVRDEKKEVFALGACVGIVFSLFVMVAASALDQEAKQPGIVSYAFSCHTDMECAEEAAQLWLNSDHQDDDIAADVREGEQK